MRVQTPLGLPLGVAQFGRAGCLERSGRRFKSCLSDYKDFLGKIFRMEHPTISYIKDEVGPKEHGVGWSARMSEEHEVTVRFCVFPLGLLPDMKNTSDT